MTAAVHRSTPSLSIPRTQNTAPVVEYSCLYTHDLRRKQKRWQDGFLRYHTFNKRIMVYDVPRNFLGDLHWTDGGAFQEGEEITLDKGGILVQVGEETGRTETDVSGITQRRDKSSPAKASPLPRSPLVIRTTPRAQMAVDDHQAKHVSLHSLLGPSRGPIGKAALSAQSPFEARYKEQESEERERKRQKMDPWSVTRTVKPSKPGFNTAASSAMPKTGLARNRLSTKTSTSQRTLGVTEFIDISSDNEEPSMIGVNNHVPVRLPVATSGPLSPDAPIVGRGAGRRIAESAPEVEHAQLVKTSYGSDSPSIRTLQRKKTGINRGMSLAADRGVGEKATSYDRVRQCSPPVSISNKMSTNPANSATGPHPSESQMQGKALKLVGNAPRKMLISRGRSSNVPVREETSAKNQSESQPEVSIHQKRLQERLSRINQRRHTQGMDTTNAEEPLPVPTGLVKDAPTTPLAQTTQRTVVVRQVDDSGGQRRSSKDPPVLLHPQARDSTGVSNEPARVTAPVTSEKESMPPPARPSNTRKQSAKQAPTYKTRTDGVTTAMLAKPFKASAARSGPSMMDATGIVELRAKEAEEEGRRGPWSEEAFDLMDWRPPDRDSSGCKKKADGAA